MGDWHDPENRGRHLRWEARLPMWVVYTWGGGEGRGSWEGKHSQRAAAPSSQPPSSPWGPSVGSLSRERTFPKGCFETVADEGACPSPLVVVRMWRENPEKGGWDGRWGSFAVHSPMGLEYLLSLHFLICKIGCWIRF